MGLGSFVSRTAGSVAGGAIKGANKLTSGVINTAVKAKEGTGDLWNDATGKTAARDAARAQVRSTEAATNFQREALNKQIELNEPWRQAGLESLGDLATGLKSGAFEAPDAEFDYSMPQTNYQDPGQYQDPGFNFKFEADPGYAFRQQQQQQAIERSAAAGGGLFSGATLADLADRSGKMASEEFGNAYNRARGSYESDRNFGRGSFESDRSFGYGAHRDQVGDAVQDRNFAYGNFSDAQARKRQSLQDRFSRLSTLAGLGEAATSRTGQAQTNFGQQAGDNAIGAGNAKAAGLVGGYNSQRDTLMGLGDLAVKTGTLFAGGG